MVNFNVMNSVNIAVISVDETDCDDGTKKKRNKGNKLAPKDICRVLCLSLFGIVAFCVVFSLPWTTIPRTNSIIFQSSWFEVLLPNASVFIISAGNVFLDLTIWTKERALYSIGFYLKIYTITLIPFIVLYISCYAIWCLYLHFNHPLPQLGSISMPTYAVFAVLLWFILPSHLRYDENFRKKLYIYILYHIIWNPVTLFLKEALNYFFIAFPVYLQFFVPFLIAGCREVDKRVRSKMISKMMGTLDEAASVLITMNTISGYSFFVAIRLVKAQLATIIFTVLIDFGLQLRTTYVIIKNIRKVQIDGIESEQSTRNMNITKLILAELTEGLTPIIYATGMVMAYYGPNAHILSNVGNSYWSVEIEDISALLTTMAFLFAIDILSVVANGICLWKAVNVNILSESCRIFRKYWFLIAVPLGMSMALYFASIDINFGMDGTFSFQWITREGWINLIYDSNDLTDEEKITILGNATLI